MHKSVICRLTIAVSVSQGLGLVAPGLILAQTNKGPGAGAPDAAQALALYNKRSFAAAADAFEAVVKRSKPDARLYYYAAVANCDAGRLARGKQILEYIVANFATSPEANLATTYLQKMGGGASGASDLRSAKASTTQDEPDTDTAAAPVKRSRYDILNGASWKKGDPVFTPEQIAREGAQGIDQSRYPNCWFQAAMSALAQLPRGQRMLANMVTFNGPEKFMVRFPGDGKEYPVTLAELKAARLPHKALWAALIEYAQVRKFPDNQGANGDDEQQNRLEVGLAAITGRKCEIVKPNACTAAELSSFIGGAVRSQNPITCATYGDSHYSNMPDLVIGSHAYTIIGYDTSRSMVIVRNPHGRNSDTFSLPSDPQHLKFEQLDDGAFKMSLPLFQEYFHCVARSFI